MQTGERTWRGEGEPLRNTRRPTIGHPLAVRLTPGDLFLCFVPIGLTLAVILWFCRS